MNSKLLDLLPYVGRLRAKLRTMRKQMGRYPAGHYYSPIPDETDVNRHSARYSRQVTEDRIDVDFHASEQYSLIQSFSRYYNEILWGDKKQENLRYHFGQEWFCYADAIFLYAYLRHMQPKRIVEIGSGYSSAVVLDTIQHFFSERPDLTLVDPFPQRLLELIRPEDLRHLRLIEDIVQNVPVTLFAELRAGDLLFIDSSHVVKAGSDLYFLLFDVLPTLQPGVVVHFHDVFYPFDYKPEWLTTGRYWNEAYFLRAFLSNNSAWRIKLMSSYVSWKYQTYLMSAMPLCLQNPGGSIYLEKIR